MQTFHVIQQELSQLLDMESEEIQMDSYVVRDLGAESIDLLELAVALNARFSVPVRDSEIFLKPLRGLLDQCLVEDTDPFTCLRRHFPYLSQERCREILGDLEGGPVLQVRDLVSYIDWKSAL